MARIPRAFIDDVLARSNIVDVIDARLRLKKSGANFVACCPFHQEKSPSFSVSESKQFYYCFGCGASGNAISFLLEYEHLSFVDAVRELADHAGLSLPESSEPDATDHSVELYPILARASDYFQAALKTQQTAIDYLKGRGFTGEICQRYGVGYAADGWDNMAQLFGRKPEVIEAVKVAGLLIPKQDGRGYYDRFRDRVMFPIRDMRGRVLGFGGRVLGDDKPKYLNSPETPTFHKGKALYGLYEMRQQCRDLPYVLIVEGYLDVMALAQHDIPQVVATLGTATTTTHLQTLFRYTDEIIFCFDGDQAGQQAAWRALETALPQQQDGRLIRFLFLPEGDDPDSFVRREGKAALLALLQQALPLADFLFARLSQEVNLEHVDGLAKLAQQAAPLIYQIPPGIMQQKLIERLASIVRMSPQKLRRLTAQAQVKSDPQSPRPTPPKAPKPLTMTPLRWVIAVLLQYPEQLAQMPAVLKTLPPGLQSVQFLSSLVESMQACEHCNAATVLESWRDDKHYSLLARLASWDLAISAENLPAAWREAVARVEAQCHEQQIELLMTKANLGGLSLEEKTTLQALIRRSHDKSACEE